MSNELFKVLEDIEKEKAIPVSYMIEKLSHALLAAVKREVKESAVENVFVDINEEKREIKVYIKKTVVETVEDPEIELSLDEALKISKRAKTGQIMNFEVKTKEFGRIAAQNAKQVIIQAIREAERGMAYQEFTSKEHEILNAQVSRIDPKTGAVVVEFGSKADKTEALLTLNEQMKTDELKEGQHLKVYLVEVRKTTKGMQMVISRTHPGLVKRLFEIEVPEIHDGIVEIISIAREAGSRTKMAVLSKDENIDPVGACVGQRGARVNSIVSELRGEKIDIIKYSENTAEYISAALSPADTIKVEVNEAEKVCSVVVSDDQLSLAIGKEGQNARLAAKLTGYKIDIKPLSKS